MQRYESWIDRQIREATERGEFDNLAGAGKPIQGLNGREDENWWIKAKFERENLEPVLPTAVALRREVAQLPETLRSEWNEPAVREIVDDLNSRIRDSWQRRVEGPTIFVRTVDVEAAVAAWRVSRSR
jgi:hypothetical protein